jgi:hypothetical protein
MPGFGASSRWALVTVFFRSAVFRSAVLLGSASGFGLSGCSNGSDTPADPVSQACLDCLSEREKGGCAAQYSACEDVRSCDDYVLCQLQGLCYERAPGAGCEAEIGCKRPSDDAPDAVDGGPAPLSPRDLAESFETCARRAPRLAVSFRSSPRTAGSKVRGRRTAPTRIQRLPGLRSRIKRRVSLTTSYF